ncbi:hypothetical protein LIER_03171 [Lithospermum erythrorhizon]|uniref:Protein LNK1 n=1 Tax=Lithospermum erythrorhizon TaxID=34254 RepID=A0AAV3NTD6_LITER
MLEKKAWSIKADKEFRLGHCKSIDKKFTLASDNSFMDSLPPSSELSGKESILSEKTVAIRDSVVYRHCFPEAEGISFFDDSFDDLGKFEDVDRMFRSWDSTFGLGTGQENDLGWLSSSGAIGKSEDVLKSGVEFSFPDSISQKSMSENENKQRSNGMTCSGNESEEQNSSAISNWSGQLGSLSFLNETSDSGGTEKKDEVIPNGQLDEQIKQMKIQNQLENHKKDQYVGHDTFFYAADVPEAGLQSIKAPHSLGYLESDITFMSSEYSFASDQNSQHPAQSGIKTENSGPTSVSPNDSYTSNQMQAKDHEASSLHVVSLAASENGECMDRPKKLLASSTGIPKSMDFSAQVFMPTIISDEKPIHYSGKSHSNGVNLGSHQELDFSAAQDSSMSSGLHDISIEATSFRQLQFVMEQMDLRTKLCIRDSLYRLAQNAEQRHQFVQFNGGRIVDDSTLAETDTKFADLMDIETDTNPIDRSVAHLLFHRPAESPVLAGGDALSFN